MHKKFQVNRTKIKGGSQSERKVVLHNSKSDLPLLSKKTWYMEYFQPLKKEISGVQELLYPLCTSKSRELLSHYDFSYFLRS